MCGGVIGSETPKNAFAPSGILPFELAAPGRVMVSDGLSGRGSIALPPDQRRGGTGPADHPRGVLAQARRALREI
jgi:hypothetical protein